MLCCGALMAVLAAVLAGWRRLSGALRLAALGFGAAALAVPIVALAFAVQAPIDRQVATEGAKHLMCGGFH